jgi:dTDP-4-dehydrorhamnose 3,5-epimerase
MSERKTLIIGSTGQLGRALSELYPNAEKTTRETLDLSDRSFVTGRNWNEYETVINASAYTAVDLAETEQGYIDAVAVNGVAVELLAQLSNESNFTLVNASTDYVFNGAITPHLEDEPPTPLGAYGKTKALGDTAILAAKRHYNLRTSWVIGKGKNFVGTMKDLSDRGIKPSVVNDQVGRLTFADELARGIKHLLDTGAPFGTYNLSNDGDSVSWADIAKIVYEENGHDPAEVTGMTTEQYYAGKEGIAPRPLLSTLSLDKIKATGFVPADWRPALLEYLKTLS